MIYNLLNGTIMIKAGEIFYDGQKVGYLTVDEGTTLYNAVVTLLTETGPEAYQRGYDEAMEEMN